MLRRGESSILLHCHLYKLGEGILTLQLCKGLYSLAVAAFAQVLALWSYAGANTGRAD